MSGDTIFFFAWLAVVAVLVARYAIAELSGGARPGGPGGPGCPGKETAQ